MTDIARRASASGIAAWDEISKRSEGRVGSMRTVCFDCNLTLPDERAARARAIGVTR